MKMGPNGFMMLEGDGTWTWLPIEVRGSDLFCPETIGTRWGGSDDAMDGGITASGVKTAGNPHILGVSLPQAGRGLSDMHGCPIPKLPWGQLDGSHGTIIEVIRKVVHPDGREEEIRVSAPLLDIGPAKWTKHGIDMTNALVEKLGFTLAQGEYRVAFRIIGGAQFIPK